MIRLEVEPYCKNCLDFEPDVIKAERTRLGDGSLGYTDTIVHCEHRRRCAGIKRYLEQQARGETA